MGLKPEVRSMGDPLDRSHHRSRHLFYDDDVAQQRLMPDREVSASLANS